MKILFIPENKRTGTAERIPNLIRILSKRHRIVCLPPVHIASPFPAIARPVKAFERIYEIFKLPRTAGAYKDVDLVFASQNRAALPAAVIAKKMGKPLVFDSHGNPELLCENLKAGPFFRWRNVAPEKRLVGKVKKLITVSQADKDAYVKMGFDEEAVEVIPTCVDFSAVENAGKKEARAALNLPQDRVIIFYFATFGYKPNVESAKYIIEILAPAAPGAQFLIAGTGKLKGKFERNVRFLGFVEHLGLFIRAADLCIAPIWHGVGIFEKVLLMMAHGKPTVVTSLAKRGIPELTDGVNCMIASTKEEFLEKTKNLAANAEKFETMGDAAAGLMMNKYNWSGYEERLFRAIE